MINNDNNNNMDIDENDEPMDIDDSSYLENEMKEEDNENKKTYSFEDESSSLALSNPPTNLNNCIYLLTHGGYFLNEKGEYFRNTTQYKDDNQKFRLPSNIRLIKYSIPGKALTGMAARYLIKSQRINKNCVLSKTKTLYYGFSNGFICKEVIEPRIIEPNSMTSNMVLLYSNDVKGFVMGNYYLVNGDYKLINNYIGQTITLENMLNVVSKYDYYDKDTTDKIYTVHQYTCHSGDYYPKKIVVPPDDSVIDNLITQFKNMEFDEIIHYYPTVSNNDIYNEMKIIIISDNFDDFTFKMVEYLEKIKKEKRPSVQIRKQKLYEDTNIEKKPRIKVGDITKYGAKIYEDKDKKDENTENKTERRKVYTKYSKTMKKI